MSIYCTILAIILAFSTPVLLGKPILPMASIRILTNALKHLPAQSTPYIHTKRLVATLTDLDPQRSVFYYKLGLRAMIPKVSGSSNSERLLQASARVVSHSELSHAQKAIIYDRLLAAQLNFAFPNGD